MRTAYAKLLPRMLEWNAEFVIRRARWIVGGSLLLAAATLLYVVKHLGVNTDTSGMIQTGSVYKKNSDHYKEAFPLNHDNLVIVVTSNSPEASRRAAKALEARLRAATDRFKSVFNPAGGEFFEKNGLLFLDAAQLEELQTNIARAQPFLSRMTQDPSLRGLFGLLAQAVEQIGKGQSFDLSPFLGPIDATISAGLEDRRAPLSWQMLMKGNGGVFDERYQIIMAQPIPDRTKMLPIESALKSIRAMAADLEGGKTEGIRVRITGEEALGYEEIQTVFHSIGYVSVLCVLLVCFILIVALRSFRLLAATLVTLVLGLIMTAGFAAVTIGHLNMVSVAFAVYYIGLGVTHSIHLCLHYRELILAGRAPQEALRESIKDTAPPLILCALTTAIGFFAFIGTAYAGVSELGLISGVGMFLSMMISLTVLPAILTIFPLPNPKLAEASRMNQWSERASAMPELHSDKICYVAAALAVASMFVLHKVRFDYDPINLRDPKSESVSTLREVSALGGGASQLSITALAPDEAAAVKTADAVAKLPSVARVMTIRSFVPENQNDRLAMIEDLALMVGPDTLQSSAHDDPKPEEQIGAIREFAAKLAGYLKGNLKASDRAVAEHIGKTTAALLTRLDGAPRDVQSALLAAIQHDLLDYLPASLDSLSTALGAHTFTLQDLPADLKDRWINAQGEYRIEVSPKQDLNDPVRLRTFVNEVLSVAPTGTDSAVDVYASGRAVIKAFQQASIWAILAIVILLFIVFRNVRDALLVMVPLLLAGLLTCGATVIFKVPFNFANVIALPLLLGVGVDNGIHIVQRMRESARRGPESAPRKSVSGGVFYSALTTLGAFANLAFASHPGMASLGKIHTISISLGLICVLVVLPALVHRVTRRKSETET